MVCRHCGTLNPDGRERCFHCDHALVSATDREGIRCRWHADRPRTATCVVCDSPVCDECGIRMEELAYCPECAAVPGEGLAAGARERVLSPLEMASYPRAGAGWRLVSGLIDALVILTGGVVLAFAFWLATSAPVGVSWASRTNGIYWTLMLLGVGAYLVGTQRASGQTPGYAATDLLLVRADGTEVTLPMALTRYVVSLASAGCLMLGFLWMLWDPDDQTWHDKAAGTIVLRTAERILLEPDAG